MNRHTKHHYKNIFLVCVGILAAILLSRSGAFHSLLLHLGTFRYFGAFLTGMLFVSTFTAPTGILMLLILAQHYTPIEIGLIAGVGAVVSDVLIFYFVRDNLAKELEDLYKQFGGSHLTHIFHSKHFRWTLPVAGALIIASPLPDELGVSLLSISKMKLPQFILTSFCMHSLGIFLIVSSSAFLKP
jgi:uncharacterized membrane protein YdjX (TVP38/TMEM64 family)